MGKTQISGTQTVIPEFFLLFPLDYEGEKEKLPCYGHNWYLSVFSSLLPPGMCTINTSSPARGGCSSVTSFGQWNIEKCPWYSWAKAFTPSPLFSVVACWCHRRQNCVSLVPTSRDSPILHRTCSMSKNEISLFEALSFEGGVLPQCNWLVEP